MLVLENAMWLLLAALALDAVIGDPDWLWRHLPHPVVWIGKLISTADRALNRPARGARTRKMLGLATLTALLLVSLSTGWLLQALAASIPYGDGLVVVTAAVFIAQNSLYRHVAAVRDGLKNDGLTGGRKTVAMIVGRDPEQLDESGVSRAAIESCAENFSDGIVAPAFWFAVLGLPGLIAYKTVNTADSMIGYRNDRYLDFGWAAARFDDLVNLPASRLSGLFVALAAPLTGGSPAKALRTVFMDARKHRSPNAGWPEAAMAGALNIALSGPRIYPGYQVDDDYINEAGRKQLNGEDIGRTLRILACGCAVQAIVIAAAGMVF